MQRSGWHVLVGLLAASGCATRPHLTLPGPGGSVEYWVGGSGTPTIVLESSIGEGFMSWDDVLDELAATTRTVAYSRGGYGDSRIANEDTLGMRTGTDVAVGLHSLLAEIGAEPPFILVGHSIGGLYALRFVGLYRDEVAALVLIDTRLPTFSRECALAGVPPCDPTAEMIVRAPTHMRAELLGLGDTERTAPTAEELGDLPVTLIASEHADVDNLRLGHQVLVRVQRDFASSLAHGRFLIGDRSGHYVQKDRPDVVIEEIRRLVAEIGASDASPTSPPF